MVGSVNESTEPNVVQPGGNMTELDLSNVDWNRMWACAVLLFVIVVGGIYMFDRGRR